MKKFIKEPIRENFKLKKGKNESEFLGKSYFFCALSFIHEQGRKRP